MDKGVLYGVGVGPGDSGLMTLKAVETIGKCPVVASPRTRNGGMVAYDIAAGAVDMSGKTVLPLDFAMSHDADERAASHRVAADQLRRELDQGRSVAMLNLGDVSIYASYRYLADILEPEGYRLEMIPGVTSFSAAAAVLGASLTDMNAPLHIIPEGAGLTDEMLTGEGTKVIMKSGRQLPRMVAQLAGLGLLSDAMMVQNCGMANEKVFRGLEGAEFSDDYFTVVIVKEHRGGVS